MHDRAAEIRKQRTRRMLQIESAVTGALGVCLIALVVFVGGTTPDVAGTAADTGFAGASMLDASVGGYILVAVVAFLFGAALTVLIKTFRDKRHRDMGKA